MKMSKPGPPRVTFTLGNDSPPLRGPNPGFVGLGRPPRLSPVPCGAPVTASVARFARGLSPPLYDSA